MINRIVKPRCEKAYEEGEGRDWGIIRHGISLRVQKMSYSTQKIDLITNQSGIVTRCYIRTEIPCLSQHAPQIRHGISIQPLNSDLSEYQPRATEQYKLRKKYHVFNSTFELPASGRLHITNLNSLPQ